MHANSVFALFCILPTASDGRQTTMHAVLTTPSMLRVDFMHSYPMGGSVPFFRHSSVRGIESLSYL
jgi:hypothetical protein